jgi:hypothetical protein
MNLKKIVFGLSVFFVSNSWAGLCKEYQPTNFAETPNGLYFGDQIIVSDDLDLKQFKSETLVNIVPVKSGMGYEWIPDPTRRIYKIRESRSSGWKCRITVDQGTTVLKKGNYSKVVLQVVYYNRSTFGYEGNLDAPGNAHFDCHYSNEDIFHSSDKPFEKSSEVLTIFNDVKNILNSKANIRIRHCDRREVFQSIPFEDNFDDVFQWNSDFNIESPRGMYLTYKAKSNFDYPVTDGPGSLGAYIKTLPTSVKQKLDLQSDFGFSNIGHVSTDCRSGVHYCTSYKYLEYFTFNIPTEPGYFCKLNPWRIDAVRNRVIVKLDVPKSQNLRNQHNLKVLANHFNSWYFDFRNGYTLDCRKRHCLLEVENRKDFQFLLWWKFL